MTTTSATTIDLGSIANAKELVFTQGGDHKYILQPKGTPEDWRSTSARYPTETFKRTTDHYIDDPDGQWFACYNVDCFDPPFAVVRARSFESAYEIFCDEFSDWLAVPDDCAADYPEDDRTYSASGVHIDTDNVQIHELHLVTVIL
jgi:hypothetical protein